MRRCFDWLVKHEKLLIGVTLVLALLLVAQIKFCKSRVEVATESSQLNTEPSQVPSLSQTPSGSRDGVSGTWDMSVQKKRGGTQNWTLKLEQNGEQLKGVINSEGGDLPVAGTIKGQIINLSAKRFGVTVEFPAVLQGDTMAGEMRVLTVTRRWTSKRRM
jgi:hypothetical protein